MRVQLSVNIPAWTVPKCLFDCCCYSPQIFGAPASASDPLDATLTGILGRGLVYDGQGFNRWDLAREVLKAVSPR